MEVFLFIVFVIACAVFLCRALNKSNKMVDRVHQRKPRETGTGTQQLETPVICTLGRPGQHRRRQPVTMGAARPGQLAPRSESTELEYDGYSRRDRHHVTRSKAHIKDEGHLEDPAAGGKGWGKQRLAH